jgi:hypothetical protein
MKIIDPDSLTHPQLVQAYKELAQAYSEEKERAAETIEAETRKYTMLAEEFAKIKTGCQPPSPFTPPGVSHLHLQARAEP